MPVTESDGVTDMVPLTVPDMDGDVVAQLVPETVPLVDRELVTVSDCVGDVVTDSDGEMVPDDEIELHCEGDHERVGESVIEPVSLTDCDCD